MARGVSLVFTAWNVLENRRLFMRLVTFVIVVYHRKNPVSNGKKSWVLYFQQQKVVEVLDICISRRVWGILCLRQHVHRQAYMFQHFWNSKSTFSRFSTYLRLVFVALWFWQYASNCFPAPHSVKTISWADCFQIIWLFWHWSGFCYKLIQLANTRRMSKMCNYHISHSIRMRDNNKIPYCF